MNGKILNKGALKAWILSKMVTLTNNLLATTPGVSAMDAAQGPVIQGQIDAINSNLEIIPEFIIDEASGQITGYKTKEGADTVYPFNSSKRINVSISGSMNVLHLSSGSGLTQSFYGVLTIDVVNKTYNLTANNPDVSRNNLKISNIKINAGVTFS